MSQHKDQARVQSVLLPLITDKVLAEGDDAAVRDCTVVNRLFIQGADPLFIMESAPVVFARLCESLDISVEDGRKAIESAHWQGPGCLLTGTGLSADVSVESDLTDATRGEALWLVLAACSDCTEEGYTDETSLTERIRRGMSAAIKVLDILAADRSIAAAVESMADFIATTEFTPDPLFGKPMSDKDHGFYVGYKQGHPCVAVQAGSLTFYGTVPGTTLEAEGVTVDKVLSPQFGIVFAKE
ncbi:hypothetical protein N9917_03555 [Deltaproteobacteria bacterium]|nr:hypothetical protein [Deltaproteobacteria bacterium]